MSHTWLVRDSEGNIEEAAANVRNILIQKGVFPKTVLLRLRGQYSEEAHAKLSAHPTTIWILTLEQVEWLVKHLPLAHKQPPQQYDLDESLPSAHP